MMKDSERSTNDLRVFRDLIIRDLIMSALIFIAVLSSLMLTFNAISQNAKNLETRCKSLGGEVGSNKCFKDGKEI